MKQLIGAALVVTLILSAAPVLAGDSFHALSRLPAGLSQLDDAQLATVEGGDICVVCSNLALVTQSNIAAIVNTLSEVEDVYLDQDNRSKVEQEIN